MAPITIRVSRVIKFPHENYCHAFINNNWCVLACCYNFYDDTKFISIRFAFPQARKFLQLKQQPLLCTSKFGMVLPFLTVVRLLMNYSASTVWII